MIKTIKILILSTFLFSNINTSSSNDFKDIILDKALYFNIDCEKNLDENGINKIIFEIDNKELVYNYNFHRNSKYYFEKEIFQGIVVHNELNHNYLKNKIEDKKTFQIKNMMQSFFDNNILLDNNDFYIDEKTHKNENTTIIGLHINKKLRNGTILNIINNNRNDIDKVSIYYRNLNKNSYSINNLFYYPKDIYKSNINNLQNNLIYYSFPDSKKDMTKIMYILLFIKNYELHSTDEFFMSYFNPKLEDVQSGKFQISFNKLYDGEIAIYINRISNNKIKLEITTEIDINFLDTEKLMNRVLNSIEIESDQNKCYISI